MQKHKSIFILSSIGLLLSFVNITLSLSNSYVSALSYESSVGVGFTFEPTLSVSLSSNDLVISNLVPGNSSDSNSINVSITTNAAYGYTLSVNANSDYLTHSNNVDTFNSIAIDADLASLEDSEDNNIWGYSTSLDSGSNWNNYNGLSSSISTTLIDNSNTADSAGNIDFKIGAKASDTQASGTYTNTITFTAVTKPTPMNLAESYFAAGKSRYKGYYTMQDMTTEICANTEVIGEGSQTQLIDIRDDKVYWATKLADNHCWMTQNLALDLETTPVNIAPLTSENTDLNDNSLSGMYSTAAGYTYDAISDMLSWKPANATKTFYGTSVSGWIDSTGILSSARKTDGTLGGHTATGNYYNWTAAVASNDSSSFSLSNTDAKNSICPKSWRLPSTVSNEFGVLNNLYNNGSTTSNTNLTIAPLWFIRSGYVYNGTLGSYDANGYYWSSTVRTNYSASTMTLDNDSINPARNHYRQNGFSVRCLAR